MASNSQIAANRQNAQKSTGPNTPEGKARVSHNAVKTGLTGQTILLPTDDAAAYTAHTERFHKKWKPATDEEHYLVQALADHEWRLLRIPVLESGIRGIARRECSALFTEETDPGTRATLIEGQIQLAYKKDFSNLALQETRLRRHRTLDTERLEALRAERKAESQAAEKLKKEQLTEATTLYKDAQKARRVFNPKLFGFDISIAEIEEHIDLGRIQWNMIRTPATISKDEYARLYRRFVGEGDIFLK